MKQLLLLILAIGGLSLFMTSCEKNNTTIDPIETNTNSGNGEVVTDYCPEIDDWVTTTYPSVSIDSVLLVTNQAGEEIYEVYLSNGATAAFDKETCVLLWSVPPPCICTYIYEPVCWNETTYDNECEAICDGADITDITEGTCTCEEACPDSYAPVCWNDTNYDNECLALCDGAIQSEIEVGSCPTCEEACPTTIDVVCWEGNEYNNECLALCAGANLEDITSGGCSGTDCVDGAVSDLFPTATIINIVSGYAAVAYGNAYYAVTLDFSGAETVVYFTEGDCQYYTICGCDAVVNMVCANNTNYINQCLAECFGYSGGDITSGACN